MNPAGAIPVEPDADMLRVVLLVRGHEAQDHNRGSEGLEYLESQFMGYLADVDMFGRLQFWWLLFCAAPLCIFFESITHRFNFMNEFIISKI